jgi:hypothetical protein
LNTAGLSTDTTLISSNWSRNDLIAQLLNNPRDISDINAHFTHYAALTALGFANNNQSEFLSSTDVATASTSLKALALANSLVFSMGCHAGLNVTDRDSYAADPGMGITPALDFPQAMAQQRAIYLASTGFGLGDDQGIAGTERLMGIFTEKLMEDNLNVGDALKSATKLPERD